MFFFLIFALLFEASLAVMSLNHAFGSRWHVKTVPLRSNVYKIGIFDLNTDTLIQLLPVDNHNTINFCVSAADGKSLFVLSFERKKYDYSYYEPSQAASFHVDVWNLETASFQASALIELSSVQNMKCMPNGHLLTLGTNSDQRDISVLQEWNTDATEVWSRSVVSGHLSSYLYFAKYENYLFYERVSGESKLICKYNFITGHVEQEIPSAFANSWDNYQVIWLIDEFDGTLLIAEDASVKKLDTSNRYELRRWNYSDFMIPNSNDPYQKSRITHIFVSNDHSELFVSFSSAGTVKFDMDTAKVERIFPFEMTAYASNANLLYGISEVDEIRFSTCNLGLYNHGGTCRACPKHSICSEYGFQCNFGFFQRGQVCNNHTETLPSFPPHPTSTHTSSLGLEPPHISSSSPQTRDTPSKDAPIQYRTIPIMRSDCPVVSTRASNENLEGKPDTCNTNNFLIGYSIVTSLLIAAGIAGAGYRYYFHRDNQFHVLIN